jgi:hypothetical protein
MSADFKYSYFFLVIQEKLNDFDQFINITSIEGLAFGLEGII